MGYKMKTTFTYIFKLRTKIPSEFVKMHAVSI